ncbi:MAG: M50 family metallopeptidase [Verrucomicrobiae bacterium]|nr:M50 family metallopeptidase [Verrucomicrobiae bacterium]
MRAFLVKTIKFLVALLLLPVFPPIGRSAWTLATHIPRQNLFLENPLSLALGGLVLWGIFAMLFRLPTRLYVFAHEMTHALFIRLCGGRVKRISVGRESGYVIADRTNFLIALAPYVFPFYAVLVGLVGLLIAFFVPLGAWTLALWAALGAALGYHWTMTLKMLPTRQSDFGSQGYFFSFVVIALGNLLWIWVILALWPTPAGIAGKGWRLVEAVWRAYQETILRTLIFFGV